MSDERLKHLEFIQAVITRMNINSFQIKGWTVTIVSALLAIYASSKNVNFIWVGIFPISIFWFLDSYYLSQELKFRGLYDDVAGVSKDPRDVKPFEMRPDLYVGDGFSVHDAFFSPAIKKFYGLLIAVLVVLFIWLK